MRYHLLLPALATVTMLGCVSVTSAASAGAAVLRPNTNLDEISPHDGKCSLREAIAAVDSPGKKTDCGTAGRLSNTIFLRATTYRLSIPRSGRDRNSTGDLDISTSGALSVEGKGVTATRIKGQSALGDRLIKVARSRALVIFFGLTLTGGHAPDGAAGLLATGAKPCTSGGNGANGGAVDTKGALVMTDVMVTGNRAGAGGSGGQGPSSGSANGCRGGNGGSGGGIYNAGTLTLTDSTVDGNRAGAAGSGGDAEAAASGAGGSGGAGGRGGGIASNAGHVVLFRSTVTADSAGAGGSGGSGGSGGGNGGGGGGGGGGGALSAVGGLLRVTNSTFDGDFAGAGANGGTAQIGGIGGSGGTGGDGGAIKVSGGSSLVVNATVAESGVGAGGGAGSPGGAAGVSGVGGGVYVQSSLRADNMTLRNSIVAGSSGGNCAGSTGSAIANGGHNLSYPDTTCPAATNGPPKLGLLHNNGGPTKTMALRAGSAAINNVPSIGAGCPSTDQRGVRRPQGGACDIGAFEFALPNIKINAPHRGARYKRGSRVLAAYHCLEGGITSPIASCHGTVADGHRINTSTLGVKSFRVTATDKNGKRSSKTVHYTVVRR